MSLSPNEGWIGVDLDGTLAHYESWVSETHIGAPIPEMVNRVKRWLQEGRDVRIFTARINPDRATNKDGSLRDFTTVRLAIQIWCVKHIGETLKITSCKDYNMAALYDDRAHRVEKNTGRLTTDAETLWAAYVEQVRIGYRRFDLPKNFLGNVEHHKQWFFRAVDIINANFPQDQ